MTKLEIVIEKDEPKPTCKHEVGGVYKESLTYYMLIKNKGNFVFLNLRDFTVVNENYCLMSDVDRYNDCDIPCEAKLIIREI